MHYKHLHLYNEIRYSYDMLVLKVYYEMGLQTEKCLNVNSTQLLSDCIL